jgi:hypothetical protein
VNEDADQRTLLRKYERELRKLRGELARRNRDLVDKRHLLELEEQKKRAEVGAGVPILAAFGQIPLLFPNVVLAP